MNTKEGDLKLLSQLWEGNHLESNELERANKILFLLKLELERRL